MAAKAKDVKASASSEQNTIYFSSEVFSKIQANGCPPDSDTSEASTATADAKAAIEADNDVDHEDSDDENADKNPNDDGDGKNVAADGGAATAG